MEGEGGGREDGCIHNVGYQCVTLSIKQLPELKTS